MLESTGLALASIGHIEAAAVIVGQLGAHHPQFASEVVHAGRDRGMEHHLMFRARTLEIVESHVDADHLMARGAAMDRYRIVEYTLAELAR